MTKYIFLLCALIAVANTHTITVRDLVEQAQNQLNDLRDLVNGEISAAHSELADTQSAFVVFSNNVYGTGIVALQQERDKIQEQVNTWKDLARDANVDPSSCTKAREQTLNRLPQIFMNDMQECIRGITTECVSIVNNANGLIDAMGNKVAQLQNSFDNCKGNLMCIQPLLKEIELAKIRIPQNIQTERHAADTLIDNLKTSSQDCADDNNAQFNTEATTILNDIISCINKLM